MRLLCVLPQNPFDPCSGAARSVRTICELLAKNGHEVVCLALMKCEGSWECGIGDGIVSHRRVTYDLRENERALHGSFQHAILYGAFNIMLTFGGTPGDIGRHKLAKECGLKIVFALRNHGYLSDASFFAPFSGILTPSRYLSNVYRASLGVQSTPIPPLIDLEDVLVSASSNTGASREPESVRHGDTVAAVEKSESEQAGNQNAAKAKYFTVINAGAPEKGRRFMERLGPELVKRGIPLLLVEGRGGRFDCPGAVWMDPVAQPKEIYAKTKVLLVPSLWQEPAGRVVAEAAVNGIPSIVSDRGGLEEMAPTFIEPIPERITEAYSGPIEAADIDPWLTFIEDMDGCAEIYQGRARTLGSVFHPDVLGPRYLEYFENVLKR